MIGRLSLENFKCFRREGFDLTPLTLLTGANGAGKSSLLQALLLIRQVQEAGATFAQLNGPDMLQLGQAADVLHVQADAPRIRVQISGEALDGFWEFTFHEEDSLVLNLSRRSNNPIPMMERGRFFYLNAERIGPRHSLTMNSLPSEVLDVGPQGEFTAQVLYHRDADVVRGPLRHPATTQGDSGLTLRYQAELWMRDLIPGIELRAESFPATNVAALRVKRGGIETEWLRAPNIGFGVSYALPIIIAGLIAPPGSLFLVENPEAHLHPAAQSKMGRFLATLATAGLQVIAETHSDHVLNGICLAAVDEHPLCHDQIVIHHFHGLPGERRAIAIRVNARGGLTDSPRGFFDQSEQDLAAILRHRRRG